MNSKHNPVSFVGHLETRLRLLEEQIVLANATVAGHLAADANRQHEYEQRLAEHGEPPKELRDALRSQAHGWNSVVVPLGGHRFTLALLPPEPVCNPYVAAAVWAEIASHPGRHLMTVDANCVKAVEQRELPSPLLGYAHLHSPIPDIVVCSSLDASARATAGKSLIDLWHRCREMQPSDN